MPRNQPPYFLAIIAPYVGLVIIAPRSAPIIVDSEKPIMLVSDETRSGNIAIVRRMAADSEA